MAARKKNFKEILRDNETKTKWVIAIFIGLYAMIGFLGDVMFRGGRDFLHSLIAVATFHVFPLFTFILAGAGCLMAFISVKMHEKMMLQGMDYRLLNNESNLPLAEKQLLNVVEELSIAGRLPCPPKVYVIDADYMNAFASGWTQETAMVAISRGLLEKLNRDEVQAVMAHEISHIRHMDIKLTLAVGAFSSTLLFALDSLARIFVRTGNSNRDKENSAAAIAGIIIFVLNFTMPIFLFLLGQFLSRTREYMADAGAVELMRDNAPLASALIKISQDYAETAYEDPDNSARASAYIFGLKSGDDWGATHPSLENRLESLGYAVPKEK